MAAKKATKTVTDSGLEIGFESGETINLNWDDFSPEMQRKLGIHGLSQKVGDSYAGAEASEAYELAKSTSDRLLANEWTQGRESGGGTARVSMLVEALALATGKDTEEALEVVKNMSDEQKKQLRKHPAIAKELAQLQAKRAAEKAEKAAAEAQAAEGSFDLSSIGV